MEIAATMCRIGYIQLKIIRDGRFREEHQSRVPEENLRRVTGCLRNRAASRNRESVSGAFEVRRRELRGSELANDGGVVYRPDRRVETSLRDKKRKLEVDHGCLTSTQTGGKWATVAWSSTRPDVGYLYEQRDRLDRK
jgi:hypothetical protein